MSRYPKGTKLMSKPRITNKQRKANAAADASFNKLISDALKGLTCEQLAQYCDDVVNNEPSPTPIMDQLSKL